MLATFKNYSIEGKEKIDYYLSFFYSRPETILQNQEKAKRDVVQVKAKTSFWAIS